MYRSAFDQLHLTLAGNSHCFEVFLFICVIPRSHHTPFSFPNFGRDKPIEVIVKPGDTLYLPPLWFHEVCLRKL